MDKEEATIILGKQLGFFRTKTYAVLKDLVGKVETYEVEMRDGVTYQIEVQVIWDDKPDGDIRVIGSIDDGGWTAFVPLCHDFIMTPDGSFLGE